MKKYKSIIILSVILVLSVVGCIATFADSDGIDDQTISYKQRLFAPKTKTLSLFEENDDVSNSKFYAEEIVDNTAGGESIAPAGTVLKYKDTVTFSGIGKYDRYIDENENEYRFDMSGKLKKFKLYDLTKDVNCANASELLSEKEAIERSREYAYVLYGDKFDGYEYEDKAYVPEMHTYTFSFAKKRGIAIVSRCFVDICTNGLLFDCDIISYENFEDFNYTMLDNISEETVNSNIDEQIKSKHSENLLAYEIKSINLKKINGKYYLSAVVNVDYMSAGDEIHSLQNYYYALG